MSSALVINSNNFKMTGSPATSAGQLSVSKGDVDVVANYIARRIIGNLFPPSHEVRSTKRMFETLKGIEADCVSTDIISCDENASLAGLFAKLIAGPIQRDYGKGLSSEVLSGGAFCFLAGSA